MTAKPCKHPDGCERPAVKTRGGWCRMHGARIERNGEPGPVQAIKPKKRDTLRKDDFATRDDFPGYGKLRCTICGRRFIDHRLTERCT